MKLRACNQPWFEMQLRHDGVASFCCYHYDIPSTGTIPELWNSPFFQKTRSEIVAGEAKGTRCEICPYLKYHNVARWMKIPDYITGPRRDNWEQALKHFRKGDIIIESLPIKYYLSFGLACNLRCKMCDHPQRFNAGENKTLDANNLLDDPRYLAAASEIYAIGGEPFLIPSGVDFIKKAALRDDLHGLNFTIHTNGYFLNRYLDVLDSYNRLSMVISVDSFGSQYEFIRKRASWERLENNIQNFIKHGREKEKPWSVKAAVTVMKSGIAGYPELMQWAVDNDLAVEFGAVASHNAEAREENIFMNPELLRDIPNWDGALARSCTILEESGRDLAAGQLKLFHADLRTRFEAWDSIASAKSSLTKANAWENVYAAQDNTLWKNLSYNIYNAPVQSTLSLGSHGVFFTPSDKRDHIASHYVDAPPSHTEGERYLRIALEWAEGVQDAEHITYEVQDQRCINLEPMGARTEHDGREKIAFYRLPDVSEKIRFILFSADQKARALPKSISLETHHTMGRMLDELAYNL